MLRMLRKPKKLFDRGGINKGLPCPKPWGGGESMTKAFPEKNSSFIVSRKVVHKLKEFRLESPPPQCPKVNPLHAVFIVPSSSPA